MVEIQEPLGPSIDWSAVGAVLFDLDGVITPTAEMHRRAWLSTFADLDFTDEDYLRHVDGRPRLDGVRAFLASRGITIDEGTTEDGPEKRTVVGLGNRKDAEFRRLLTDEGLRAYPGTLALVGHLDEIGCPMAVVTSSRNASLVLGSAGLGGRFPVVVDGLVAEAEKLRGKPAPDTFLRASEILGVPPENAVVIEDAETGVAAGIAGGFSLVIGVDRTGNRKALAAAGAHLIVADLSELVPAPGVST